MKNKCPECHSEKIKIILYGEPSPNLDRFEDKIEFGGCDVIGNPFIWSCMECKNEWGKYDNDTYDAIVETFLNDIESEKNKKRDLPTRWIEIIKDRWQIFFALPFIILIIWISTLDLIDGLKPSENIRYTPIYQSFYDYDCIDDCSGHEAGYEWAENNDISDIDECWGNSQSFIEGCWVYVEENY